MHLRRTSWFRWWCFVYICFTCSLPHADNVLFLADNKSRLREKHSEHTFNIDIQLCWHTNATTKCQHETKCDLNVCVLLVDVVIDICIIFWWPIGYGVEISGERPNKRRHGMCHLENLLLLGLRCVVLGFVVKQGGHFQRRKVRMYEGRVFLIQVVVCAWCWK